MKPSLVPSLRPSSNPSINPSLEPSRAPSSLPSLKPSFVPSSLPTFEVQVEIQNGIQMEMRGIESMSTDEVLTFERQTEEYYAYFHNIFKDNDDVFGVEAEVFLTNRTSGDNVLLVTFTARMSYFTTDSSIDFKNLITEPFQQQSDRDFYVDEYLKADDEYQNLRSVSSVSLPNP